MVEGSADRAGLIVFQLRRQNAGLPRQISLKQIIGGRGRLRRCSSGFFSLPVQFLQLLFFFFESVLRILQVLQLFCAVSRPLNGIPCSLQIRFGIPAGCDFILQRENLLIQFRNGFSSLFRCPAQIIRLPPEIFFSVQIPVEITQGQEAAARILKLPPFLHQAHVDTGQSCQFLLHLLREVIMRSQFLLLLSFQLPLLFFFQVPGPGFVDFIQQTLSPLLMIPGILFPVSGDDKLFADIGQRLELLLLAGQPFLQALLLPGPLLKLFFLLCLAVRCGAKSLLFVFQAVVLLQQGGLRDCLFPAGPGLRLLCLRFFQILFLTGLLLPLRFEGFSQLLRLRLFCLDLLRLLDPPDQDLLLPVQCSFLLPDSCLFLCIDTDQRPDQDDTLLRRLFARQDLVPPEGGDSLILSGVNVLQITPAVLREFPECVFIIGGFLFQPFLQLLIVLRVENPAEDFLPGLCVRQQEFEKFPLGDHGDSGKLILAEPQQFRDCSCHRHIFGLHSPVRIDQLRVGQLFGHPFPASFLRTLISRIALHLIYFSTAFKNKLYLSPGLRKGILGTEHGLIPVVAAGSPVEGKADRVKNSRLAGACISGNEVESLPAERLKIYGLTGRVGAECGHFQFQWSHELSSSCKTDLLFPQFQIFSINLAATSF